MLGPRDMDPTPNDSLLQRQSSAKQLINRYESMSPGPSSRPPPCAASASSTPLKVPAATTSFELQDKEKSPIRHSLRNLFSVFKKANIRKGKQPHEERPLSSFRREYQSVVDDRPTFSAPPVLRSRSRKLTSSLLYLAQTPQHPSNPPVLPTDSIVISCLTAHGNPSIHTIQLSNCTDVRSLSMEQLNPEEGAMLPKRREIEELKIFEILFEGRPREKFAANSVQERAGWVSAVWDTILPAQDAVIGPERRLPQTAESTEEFSTSSCALKTHSPMSATAISSAASDPERSLPPIPVMGALRLDTQWLGVHSRTSSSSPLSPSIYPPTRPVSRASSNASSQPSPSIANLSQLSVVRQRLAQMEPTSSQSSDGGLTSPTSSRAAHSSRLSTPVLRSPKALPTSPPECHDMMRNQSAQSSVADSILASYGVVPTKRSMEPILESLVHPAPDDALLVDKSSDQPHSTTGQIRHQSSMMYPGLEPVVELLRDQSAKTYDQTANLGDQVLSLQNDVQKLPSEIASSIGLDAHSKTVLNMVAKIEEQARSSGEAIGSMQNSLEEHWSKNRSKASSDSAKLVQELQSIRERISQDLSVHQVKVRLDDLLLASTASAGGEKSSSTADPAKIEDMLTKVLALLEKDASQQALQAQQQSDSVRYLNELNSWLEAFVNNGTSVEGGPTVVAEIRQLALDMAARDHRSVALQASVDGLLAMLHEQSAASNVASIATLIDRQRQDHEWLLRAFTTEIASEIKGERLRFVDAMKEATAINVQIHVEQFKKELKREVIEMTEEVERLHQDRQAMQNQIADLFAFYTKQKAAELSHAITSAHGEQKRSTTSRPLPQPHRLAGLLLHSVVVLR
ncbi:hypothetical protein FPV67DRAFT_1488366 [Lyophyllum atratum]|nr:hypothetical protein FPV67DRAFT_1488366 [Lyophyllum atratum]